MSDPRDRDSAGPDAPGALAREIAEARSVLGSLQADIRDAESRLHGTEAHQLLQANEQLVLAMLQAQSETDSAVAALETASHSAERRVYGSCCPGVARWLCGESGIGAISLGPRIWLNTDQIPAGADTSSMKPSAINDRAVMREAKFAASK